MVGWTVIIPVKRLPVAKSRLRGAIRGVRHADLVLAMVLDTTEAALASPVVARVVVVTADPAAGRAAAATGAEVIADEPAAGINAALTHAETRLRRAGGAHHLAALAADLPALRAGELAEALRLAGGAWRPEAAGSGSPASPEPVRRYAADADGSGTVLLAAPGGLALRPCFGAGSAAAHAASAAVPLIGGWPGLRRDVDTPADLAEAARLGLGPRTRTIAHHHRDPPRPVPRRPGQSWS